MPSRPSATFTIPSVLDALHLECRIYNPPYATLTDPEWRPRAAVVAHPYAPLGGCYDDEVVLSLVEEVSKRGFLVGTFNFRGTHGSKGHTSWTGAAELNDYISFAGFMINYMIHLHTLLAESTITSESTSHDHLRPEDTPPLLPHRDEVRRSARPPLILLSGYSYGALTTSRLPPTSAFLSEYSSPSPGSIHTEILSQAQDVAKRINADIQTFQVRSNIYKEDHHHCRSPTASPILAAGGHNLPSPPRLSSHRRSDKSDDSSTFARRSVDAVRRSMSRTSTRDSSHQVPHHRSQQSDPATNVPPDRLSNTEHRAASSNGKIDLELDTAYFLLSPLLGPIAGLLTMFQHSPFKHFSQTQSDPPSDSPKPTASEVSRNEAVPSTDTPSRILVIYGTKDTFTSSKRLRKWCEEEQERSQREKSALSSAHGNMNKRPSASATSQGSSGSISSLDAVSNNKNSNVEAKPSSSTFEYHEIEGASHFWREDDGKLLTQEVLGKIVGAWLDRLIDQR